jgi:hypothetical protein
LEHSSDDHYEEYTGRDFEKGISDCVTIFREFYKKEIGFEIHERFNWKTIHKNLKPIRKGKAVALEVIEFMASVGFEKIDINSVEDLRKNDAIILYSDDDTFVAHILVYLGNGKVIFQPRDSKSQIRDYGKAFLKDTACGFRKIK